MFYTIMENERGYLVKNGRFIKMLNPGRHFYLNSEVRIFEATGRVNTAEIPIEILLQDSSFSSSVTSVSMKDREMGILYVDKKLTSILSGGRKLFFWNIFETCEVEIFQPVGEVNLHQIPVDVILKNQSLKDNVVVVEVKENERAVHLIDGEIVDVLPPTVKLFWNVYQHHEFIKSNVSEKIDPAIFPIKELLSQDVAIRNLFTKVDVRDFEIAFHMVDGRIDDVLETGVHFFWNTKFRHTFETFDISKPMVQPEITNNMFKFVPDNLYTKIEVGIGEVGVVFYDNLFKKSYEPGVYFFWNTRVKVTHENYDMKLKELNIDTNLILTSDKTALRIGFFCNYRISKEYLLAESITDYKSQVENYIKTLIRQFVAARTLDEVLDKKDELSKYVLEELKLKEKEFFLKFSSAGVKEITLPEDVKNIMNIVLAAEKRAEAEAIRRKEEVESTKTLLETAKLMDKNPTLYRLKELEYIERIFEKVDNVSFGAKQDLIEQLAFAIDNSDSHGLPVLRDIKQKKI